MKRRTVYLSMKSLSEARELFLKRAGRSCLTEPESVDVEDALGRITAEPVYARYSSPAFHSAAMDGIAVRAEATYGTTERRPRILEIEKDYIWVNTGQVLPEGLDAVIMVEKVQEAGQGRLEIRSPAFPWQNVRKVGEDIVATQLLLPQGHRITPYDLGALAGAGVFSISVRRRPRVVIIPTGSELVSRCDARKGPPPGPGRIIEYNSLMLAGLVRESGGVPEVFSIVPDREEDIRAALERTVSARPDLVIINAGSSAGSSDFTVHALAEMGEVLVHGVAIMPGKPTILAMVGDIPVIGNPGYPVSSAISFSQFSRPLLHMMQGVRTPAPRSVRVKPTRDIAGKLGIEEFVRVNIGRVGGCYVATPLPRAAGSITSLTRAEGIVRIPALSEGISQDEEIEAELLVEEEDLANTIVIVGSHDITLDILGDEIKRIDTALRVSSGNVGSLGGLMALKKGACHAAGSHLLDTQSGQYNLSYIKRYLKGMAVCVFHLVLRDQGLMVAKGNPKNIKDIKDLGRPDITFVNRQAGSGTRVLLDFKLKEVGIDPGSVKGYGHEEFTHMAVAVDVLSGAADCGMGIMAAAKALDLDFIPVVQEQYDLVIPANLKEHYLIKALLETVRSAHFRERVSALGGYDPSRSGELWMEVDGR
jgi:putative molybdopterin biosynthesis protein